MPKINTVYALMKKAKGQLFTIPNDRKSYYIKYQPHDNKFHISNTKDDAKQYLTPCQLLDPDLTPIGMHLLSNKLKLK